MKANLVASAALALSLLFAPAARAHDAAAASPPAGSNERLRSPISGVPGVEVIISDVVIPPNATVPRHTHPGEEFVYVIEGSALHVEQGKPDRLYVAGESFVIPPLTAHAPRGGPAGARAIVFRVHKAGEPERTLVPEIAGAPKP
ncbi:MAG: cupin domain-containing protein [Alphaproteobacteria bacterium]|nr:cupin domain-containing protein [Alphaproteobacteria bacterium]